jgi:TetR/AcrR family transcriptional regulator
MPPIKVKNGAAETRPVGPAGGANEDRQQKGAPPARSLPAKPARPKPARARVRPLTRIQREKQNLILEAALEVFSRHGFRGATIDQIAARAGMSKPNLLYYFPRKEAIYKRLIAGLLDTWLAPLREMDASGDPVREIRSYIRRKLEMARDFPRESRMFANEMLQGAPRVLDMLEGELKALVDEKAAIILSWMEAGKLSRADPRHLIFSIWATTQHYADFDVQVRAVLGPKLGAEGRFEDAARFLEHLFLNGLLPRRPAD